MNWAQNCKCRVKHLTIDLVKLSHEAPVLSLCQPSNTKCWPEMEGLAFRNDPEVTKFQKHHQKEHFWNSRCLCPQKQLRHHVWREFALSDEVKMELHTRCSNGDEWLSNLKTLPTVKHGGESIMLWVWLASCWDGLLGIESFSFFSPNVFWPNTPILVPPDLMTHPCMHLQTVNACKCVFFWPKA